ncbi:hypothetical protein MRX96_058737 [Rhipicephalus microplus]
MAETGPTPTLGQAPVRGDLHRRKHPRTSPPIHHISRPPARTGDSRVVSPDLRSTADTFASINFLHDRVRSPYQVRPQPCTGPLLHKAGNRLPRCTRAAHNRCDVEVTGHVRKPIANRVRRPTKCARNPVQGHIFTRLASGIPLRAHAAWREASSRVASPPPQLEWPSFLNGTGTAKHLDRRRTTIERLKLRQRFANSCGRLFPLRGKSSRRAFRINRVRSEPQTSGAASSPPCALRANVPCSRGKAWRRHGPAACSSARSTGHPAYFEGNKRNARLRSRALCARLEKLCWPAFAPRVYRALKLRVRGSRSSCAPGRREEYATSTALSLQASFRLEVLRRSQRGATSSMQSVAPVLVGLWHDGRHRLALEWPLLALVVRCSACCPCCRRGQNESTAHVPLCAEGSLDM